MEKLLKVSRVDKSSCCRTQINISTRKYLVLQCVAGPGHLHSPGRDVGVVDGLGGGAAVPGVHLLPHLAICRYSIVT